MPPNVLGSPVRVGLAGLGRKGMYQLQRLSLRQDFQTVATHDLDPGRAVSAAASGCCFHKTWNAFLADPQIELVWIATPPATHARLAIEALGAGKHVVVEAPPCLNVGEADRMEQAARHADRSLSIALDHCRDDDFSAAMEAVRSGELGRLLAAKLIVWDYGFPRGARRQQSGERTTAWEGGTGGLSDGALLVFGTRYLDQLLSLAPGEPTSLFARVPGGDLKQEDAFTVSLDFSDGMMAQIEVNLGSFAPLATGWRLSGTKGGYGNFRRYVQSEEGEIFDVPCSASPRDGNHFYDDLRRRIRQRNSPTATIRQARCVVELIEAARKSAQNGQVVILPSGRCERR